jgi:antitoxin CptB
MTINIDDLKKKIIYRSNYRGTKEMDILLGAFTKKYIDILNYTKLIELDEMLNLDDENLFKINQGQETTIKIKQESVLSLFKSFKYKK